MDDTAGRALVKDLAGDVLVAAEELEHLAGGVVLTGNQAAQRRPHGIAAEEPGETGPAVEEGAALRAVVAGDERVAEFGHADPIGRQAPHRPIDRLVELGIA